MSFSSSSYALLLALVVPLYHLLGERKRQNYLLLATGLFFYGSWDARFLFLLLFSASVDYVGGLGIVHLRVSRGSAALLATTMLVAGFVLCAPLDWQAIRTAILPASAFTGGWAEPAPWRLFVSGGSWRNSIAAVLALVSLGVTTAIGYSLPRERHPRYFLCVSLVANLALLGFFKYFDFFVDSAATSLASLGLGEHRWMLGIIVPPGISFYTFQAMSYSIDVYRGVLRPTRHFPDYLLFVSFFPHLVAGPIQEANWLLPQLQRARTFEWDRFQSGVFLIGWGLFKKIYIADNLARVVETGAFTAASPTPLAVVFATYAFALQIYADFSAYSDIARGTSRLLGIELTLNFNIPYASTNPREFWRRWHISLSTWLRDYLYVPLGGSRGGTGMLYRNLMITMALGGLWHGARLNFLLWGIYQGALLCVHRLCEPALRRIQPERPLWRSLWTAMCWAVFFHLVCYGWLLFRADSAHHIATLTAALAGPWRLSGAEVGVLARIAWFSWPLVAMELAQWQSGNLLAALTWPWPLRTAVYVALFYLVVIFGSIDGVPFIYFQF